jgi:outer membrane protein TolC
MDSAIYKNQSQYSYNIYTQGSKTETKLPFNQNQIFTGTKTQIDRIAAGVEKQFSTGTYFMTEVSTVRFDNNAFENTYTTPPQFSFLNIRPLHTGAVTFKISQELMKYSFGRNGFYNPFNGEHEANKVEVLKKQAEIQRENLINQLVQIVTGTLIEYWSLSISEDALSTFERLYKNAEDIRRLTVRKQVLGIAERFEESQWSSLVESFDGRVQKARLDRNEIRRRLKRILGVDPTTQVSGLTDLQETLPEFNYDADLKYAYEHRIDFLNIKRRIQIAKLNLQISEDEDVPSLKLGFAYSTRSQSLLSPQSNFYINNDNGVRTFKHPEIIADITLKYPLWDKGIKTDIRDAKTNLKQYKEQEGILAREIADELRLRLDSIKSSYEILRTSKKTEEETKKFYDGVLNRFSQGKFSAILVKNALDALANAELNSSQSKINFNINLIRYELTKNSLFDKYDIKVYEILENLKKMKNE